MNICKIKLKISTILLGTLLCVTLTAGCASRILSPEGTTTTVVLIRHAERTAITKELTEGGRARAEELPSAVADLDIVAIYSPNLSRNIDTVKPLAAKLGLEIELVARTHNTEEITKRLISEHPGKTVLWVGNQGNLVRIYSRLGGTGEAPLYYGDLYVLRVPDRGDTQVIKRRFGNTFYN